jgi:hypothetical protein
MTDRQPQQLHIPGAVLQQILGQKAEKPADVVEVICGNGCRSSFNMDDVERIDEEGEATCLIKLRGEEDQLAVAMAYDEFLLRANVQPKQLHRPESDTGS